MEKAQSTILHSLETQLNNQIEWYRKTDRQLIQLEKSIEFYTTSLNLNSEKTISKENSEIAKSPETVADYVEFISNNFRIISQQVLDKLIYLNEEIIAANERLADESANKKEE